MNVKKKFTPLHRLLHWLTTIVLSVIFLTGFLRMTWMDKRHMGAIIGENVSGDLLSSKEALDVAKAIRAPMWEWHVYFAYAMVIIFAARLIYMWAKGIRFPHPFKKTTPLRQRIEGFSYLFFYILIGINIVTGFYHLWGTDKFWRHQAGVVHKWAIYWFPIFILIHFAGFVIAELSNRKGIVSKMIGGEK